MRKFIKRSAFFVLLALSISTMVLPAFAAPVMQDGLEATLITDKEIYDEGENVTADLRVKTLMSLP